MQFILNKIIQNTKETLQVPSCADASARATVKCIETIFTRLVILSVDDVRVTCRNARLLCYDTDSFLQSLAGHSYSSPDRDRLSIVLYPVFPRLEYIAGYGVLHSYDEHKHQI